MIRGMAWSLVAALAWVGLVGPALASAIPVGPEPIIEQLGMDIIGPLRGALKNGQSVEVLVKSPEKLLAHNIRGLPAGRHLLLTAVRARKLYELKLAETGETLLLQLGARGVIKLLSPAGPGAQGQTVSAYEFYMKYKGGEGKLMGPTTPEVPGRGLGADVKLRTPLEPVPPVMPMGGKLR